MASQKPAIVLATGAWHVPALYEPMLKPLREAGFEVFCPKSQSLGIAKDPGNALQLDAAALAQVVQQLLNKGKDIIFVMHSYGGISGTEAVGMVCEDQTTRVGAGRIRRLVFLAARMIPKGTSMLGAGQTPPGTVVSEDGMMTHQYPGDRYYHEISQDDAKPAVALLEPQALSTFNTQTKYAGWKDYGIPCTYIKCTQDIAVPSEHSDSFIRQMKEAGVDVDVETIEAGHCPNWTAPSPVVGIIEKVAKKLESE